MESIDEKIPSVAKWNRKNRTIELKSKGKEVQGRTDWEWALDIEKATGQNLYRYEVRVESPNSEKIQSSLAVYLIKSN